jgi:hypothetical protein
MTTTTRPTLDPSTRSTRTIKDTTGTIALWETSSDFVLTQVQSAFASVALGKLAPRPRTELAALKSGLHMMHGRSQGQRVAPLGDGYAVLHERVGADRQIETTQVLTAWFEGDPSNGGRRLCVTPAEQWHEVKAAMDTAKGNIDGEAVSAALVNACAALCGFPLRRSGGVYWLPEGAHGDWERLGAGIEAASPTKSARCHSLRTTGDARTIRAVVEAFTREADALTAEVGAELDAGGVSEKVANNRAAAMAERVANAELLEKVLGVGLEEVKGRMGAMQERSGNAALLALNSLANPSDD